MPNMGMFAVFFDENPDEGERMKFHLSLNVENLEKSVEFYQRLFDTAPTKLYPDYAKFELQNPPLVLALEPSPGGSSNKLNHFGLRYDAQAGLATGIQKVYAAGLEAQLLQSVDCCYARQSKACLNDPDGNMVELYIVEADLERSLDEATPAAKLPRDSAQAAPKHEVWEHLLGSEFPTGIPEAENCLDEVRLRGTFNARAAFAKSDLILMEVLRVLKPGGELSLHLLVSDQEISGQLPKLPGPAANVDYTPLASGVFTSLENAGFTGLHVKRLSHAAVFQFKGARMRELLVTARKKPARELESATMQSVVYKGPARSLTDDFGTTYKRGEPVAVSGRVFEALKTGEIASQFFFLTEGQACRS